VAQAAAVEADHLAQRHDDDDDQLQPPPVAIMMDEATIESGAGRHQRVAELLDLEISNRHFRMAAEWALGHLIEGGTKPNTGQSTR
jgi:hypothetical protein